MTTRNKRKLAALNKENCEEHPRSKLAQNSNPPRSQEDYITQVSEEIEGRVTKRLSKEFSRTENRILGALARLDDFLMNPLLQGHSGALLEHIEYKPGNEWGRLPEWSSSWSGPLPQPVDTKLWPRRWPRHSAKKFLVFKRFWLPKILGRANEEYHHSCRKILFLVPKMSLLCDCAVFPLVFEIFWASSENLGNL